MEPKGWVRFVRGYTRFAFFFDDEGALSVSVSMSFRVDVIMTKRDSQPLSLTLEVPVLSSYLSS